MKKLKDYIYENVNRENANMLACNTVDDKAGTFYKDDIIECLEEIKKVSDIKDIKITAYDMMSPRTVTYKYYGINDNVLTFKSDNTDFINQNLIDKIINDLNKANEIVTVKFDKCKYVQMLDVYYDDFKNMNIMSFEG